MDNKQEMDNLLGEALKDVAPQETDPNAGVEEGANTLGDSQEQVEETKPEQVEETKPEEDKKTSNPMRELRKQYEKTQGDLRQKEELLARVARSKGFENIEALEQSLAEEESKRLATERGIPLEVQKEISQLRESLTSLEKEREAENFNMRARQLIQENQLSNEEFTDFARKAQESGFNILKPGTDLSLIYKAMNLDNILASEVEKAKQQVLADIQSQKESSPTTGPRKNISQTQTKEKELDPSALFSELFK